MSIHSAGSIAQVRGLGAREADIVPPLAQVSRNCRRGRAETLALARAEGRGRGQEVVCLAAPPDMFPATLFDFNGVLVNDEAVHLAAFRDALAGLGITLTDEAYVERYLGFDDRGAFRPSSATPGGRRTTPRSNA